MSTKTLPIRCRQLSASTLTFINDFINIVNSSTLWYKGAIPDVSQRSNQDASCIVYNKAKDTKMGTEPEQIEQKEQTMTPEELERFEKSLSIRPEYNWLTQNPSPWRNMSEVATGMGVSRQTIKSWCERGQIPGAIDYGQDIGWRMPRSGLIEFIANLQRGASGQAG